jgi:hypothetical protein
MNEAFIPTIAALLGAIIGGLLSVLASWLAQRVQAKAQWLSQEILRRQQLYSEFIEAATRCYATAVQSDEIQSGLLARLYAEIGRMRLHSSEAVIKEAYGVVHKILDTYAESNLTSQEIRELLAKDSVDFLSGFGEACRRELEALTPEHRLRR